MRPMADGAITMAGCGGAVLRITPSITVRPAGVVHVYHVKSGSPPGWGPGTEVRCETTARRCRRAGDVRVASPVGVQADGVRRARRRGSSRHRRSGQSRTDRGARHPTGAQHLVEVEQRVTASARHFRPDGVDGAIRDASKRSGGRSPRRHLACARSRAAGWPRSPPHRRRARARAGPRPCGRRPPCRGPGPHDGALGAGDVVHVPRPRLHDDRVRIERGDVAHCSCPRRWRHTGCRPARRRSRTWLRS